MISTASVTPGKSLMPPGFSLLTPLWATKKPARCGLAMICAEEQGLPVRPPRSRVLWELRTTILSSQLHLGAAMHLPQGSMGSHYHCHMLMTPINSPSVGPMQPSALKVKGRGLAQGESPQNDSYKPVCVAWENLWPRFQTVQYVCTCVCAHVFIT